MILENEKTIRPSGTTTDFPREPRESLDLENGHEGKKYEMQAHCPQKKKRSKKKETNKKKRIEGTDVLEQNLPL
jgi:hypothetical protein